MIELAPNHKRGLALTGPLILAAGAYGQEYENDQFSHAHAIATLPTSIHAQLGSMQPEAREIPGGALVNRAGANPGFASVLSAQRHFWKRISIPILLTLAGQDAAHWAEMAGRVGSIAAIGGLVLELSEDLDAGKAVEPVRSATQLPLLAVVPIEGVIPIAERALRAGANALVVGLGPWGLLLDGGTIWQGRLSGPCVKPLALRATRDLSDRFPEVPLIGMGGIQTASDVREFMRAGEDAVQIDTSLWRTPGALVKIAGELNPERDQV